MESHAISLDPGFFFAELMPVLTPIGLDPAHPFPRLLNKSLNFAVELEGRDAFGRNAGHAIVQAPRALPRVIALPEDIAGCQYGFVFSLVDSARPRWRAVWLHDSARLLPVPRDPEQ